MNWRETGFFFINENEKNIFLYVSKLLNLKFDFVENVSTEDAVLGIRTNNM